MPPPPDRRWFAVRCILRFPLDDEASARAAYEERITLWRTASVEAAIERAEEDAERYADSADGEYLGLAQAFEPWLENPRPSSGDEVFSLMRTSDLDPDDYLDQFFDTGTERQRTMDERP